MVQTVAREVTIDRKGNPRLIMRKFDPGGGGPAAGADFGQMLNATEEALKDIDYEKAADKDREAIGNAVRQKILAWGLFKYLGKRGEMGNHYRMKRSMETTGPGLKRVTDKQLDIEMDSVMVLVMCNPLVRPDRKKFISRTDYRNELKRMKVRIDLPLVTGHPTVHILPEACLAFTLRGEGMIRRNFEGIRYEIYSDADDRHKASHRKFRLAQDGRSLEDDSDAAADLWYGVEVKAQDEIEDSQVFTGEPVKTGGLDLSEAGNYQGGDVSEQIESLERKPFAPPESELMKSHGITFQIIYNRAQGGKEPVTKLCEEFDFDRGFYYRLKKEHEKRMEIIHGPAETEEPSGSEGSPGQRSEPTESD